MKSIKLILYFFCCLLFLNIFVSCEKNNPVENHNLPDGIPDWNNKEFDWIVNMNESPCWIYGDWWFPKFYLGVRDISNDGNILLIHTYDGLIFYDVNSRTIVDKLSGNFNFADYSNDGKKIIITETKSSYTFIKIYNLIDKSWFDIILPDTAEIVVPIAIWLPGDTSLVTAIMYPHDNRSHAYSVEISPPHKLKLFPTYSLSSQFFNNKAYDIKNLNTGSGDHGYYDVNLKISSIGDTSDAVGYLLPGLASGYVYNMSKSGNWLVARSRADFRNTRFSLYKSIDGLCVIDLRPNSATQYKIFRFFTDHVNALRNCCTYYDGAGGVVSKDDKYIYHEWIRMSDSTMQIVRRNIFTGEIEEISNFLKSP
jgi:hypothetical protein